MLANSYSYIKDVPISYNYSLSSNGTAATIAEGSQITFTVTRSGTGSASTVYASTSNGTATGGSDYGALTKVAVNFAATETTKTFIVNTYADSVTEGNEYFYANVYKNSADTTSSASSYAYIKDAPVSVDYQQFPLITKQLKNQNVTI